MCPPKARDREKNIWVAASSHTRGFCRTRSWRGTGTRGPQTGPPARCLLVQTVPSAPGTLPRAVCPPRLRDSLGPRVRSVHTDTASLGSPLLTQSAPGPIHRRTALSGLGVRSEGCSAPCRLRVLRTRGPGGTPCTQTWCSHWGPTDPTHQGAWPGRQGLSCAAPGAPEAVEWPRGPLLAGSCSRTSPSEMWGLGPCRGHQGPQQASPPHHFTRPHIPGRILLCSPLSEPDP